MTRIFTKKQRPIAEALGQILIVISLLASLAYGMNFFPHAAEGLSLSTLTKGVATGGLALFALLNIKRTDIFLLFLALTCGTIGDILINGSAPQAFSQAVIAFGLGHIFYLALFLGNLAEARKLTSRRLWFTSVLWALIGFGFFMLWTSLSEQSALLLVYAALLVLVATAAILSRYPVLLAGAGGVFFLISDALLAAGRFMDLPDAVSLAVWPTYYFAQFLICFGVVLSPAKGERPGGYRFS